MFRHYLTKEIRHSKYLTGNDIAQVASLHTFPTEAELIELRKAEFVQEIFEEHKNDFVALEKAIHLRAKVEIEREAGLWLLNCCCLENKKEIHKQYLYQNSANMKLLLDKKSIKKQIDNITDKDVLQAIKTILDYSTPDYDVWEDKAFVEELDKRSADYKAGKSKRYSLKEVEDAARKSRLKNR